MFNLSRFSKAFSLTAALIGGQAAGADASKEDPRVEALETIFELHEARVKEGTFYNEHLEARFRSSDLKKAHSLVDSTVSVFDHSQQNSEFGRRNQKDLIVVKSYDEKIPLIQEERDITYFSSSALKGKSQLIIEYGEAENDGGITVLEFSGPIKVTKHQDESGSEYHVIEDKDQNTPGAKSLKIIGPIGCVFINNNFAIDDLNDLTKLLQKFKEKFSDMDFLPFIYACDNFSESRKEITKIRKRLLEIVAGKDKVITIGELTSFSKTTQQEVLNLNNRRFMEEAGFTLAP